MTVDSSEIDYFTKHAAKWWKKDGPFAPLHKMNPLRMDYLQTQITAHFKDKTFKDLRILDIGCGGGLISEKLAELGATVYGLDADEQAIEIAKAHAEEQEFTIHYRHGAVEDLQKTDKEAFDVLIAFEIVEHVSDLTTFIQACVPLVKKDGLLIFSTVNRTPQSFALGIVAAEYICRWVEPGTHNWNNFVKPSELSRALRKTKTTPSDITGLVYHPLTKKFALSPHNVAINYFLTAKKTK